MNTITTDRSDEPILHVDPVCGMSVTVHTPHSVLHNGVVYRFCSGMCRDAFMEHPHHYLKPIPSSIGRRDGGGSS